MFRSKFAARILFMMVVALAGSPSAQADSKSWYEKLTLRGYTQFRYNRLFETNRLLKCDQCDKSWGNGGSFFLRRGRLILSGDSHDRLFIYIQPDFASDSGSSQHYLQIRDAYFDLSLDAAKEFRIRFGQSKVPYGFENLQSSSNRAPLDRADALNSGAPNERDLGAFFYWAPAEIRKRFKDLQNAQFKGSGDYGVFGIGLYNGQIANRPELNNNRHIIARITYPFAVMSDQVIEAGISGYSGIFSVDANREFSDQRFATHFVWYPKPFGISAEWTVGKTPMFRRDLGAIVKNENLYGGYLQAMYNLPVGNQQFFPFTRIQFFNGAKKHETNAPKVIVRELEMGTEWAPIPAFELTASYVVSSRVNDISTAASQSEQTGQLLRLQAQFNY